MKHLPVTLKFWLCRCYFRGNDLKILAVVFATNHSNVRCGYTSTRTINSFFIEFTFLTGYHNFIHPFHSCIRNKRTLVYINRIHL